MEGSVCRWRRGQFVGSGGVSLSVVEGSVEVIICPPNLIKLKKPKLAHWCSVSNEVYKTEIIQWENSQLS